MAVEWSKDTLGMYAVVDIPTPQTVLVHQAGDDGWVASIPDLCWVKRGFVDAAAAKSAALAEARRLLREALEEIGDG